MEDKPLKPMSTADIVIATLSVLAMITAAATLIMTLIRIGDYSTVGSVPTSYVMTAISSAAIMLLTAQTFKDAVRGSVNAYR